MDYLIMLDNDVAICSMGLQYCLLGFGQRNIIKF